MARVVWKGAIVFGLVHVPVDLYPGSKDNDLDFDWLDKRDNAPIGYQRINKETGKPVDMKNIVRAYEWEKGRYVVLEDEDFKAANPKATQTVEILAFVDRESIPPQYFERPYRLVPGKRGEKGYALLREALKRTDKVGVAQVVIRTKQHIAILMPVDDMLELITVRYADEVLGAGEFDLPSGKVNPKELQLAERLIDDMAEPWNPRKYHDTYRDDLMKRIETLATKGRTKAVKAPEQKGAEVIDLMAALRRSLEGKGTKGARGAANDEGESKTGKRAAASKRKSARSTKSTARKRAA